MNKSKKEILERCSEIRKRLVSKRVKAYELTLNSQSLSVKTPSPEYIKKRAKFIKAIIKKGGKCNKCGLDLISNFFAADFHHLEPKLKSFSLSDIHDKAWKEIRKEIDKCVLLCSNCHREEHSLNSTTREFLDQIMEQSKYFD